MRAVRTAAWCSTAASKPGRPTNGESLTFDRWHQDQTIQLVSTEDGQSRETAVKVNDRPDQPMDIGRAGTVLKMPAGPARTAAFKSAGFAGVHRVYLGRSDAKESLPTLRDGTGRPRLRLVVTDLGEASIQFLDARGQVTRTIAPTP